MRDILVGLDKEDRNLIIFILAFSICMATYTIMRHLVFYSLAYDLGIFSQALWTTLHDGLFFYETPDFIYSETGSFFGVHFSPIMFLILSIYAVFPSPITLIILQIIIIDISSIFLYKLSNRILENKTLSLLIALLYLIHPAVIGGLIYDFHLEVFLPLFLYSALYAYEKRDLRSLFLYTTFLLIVLDFASILLVFLLVFYFGFLGNIDLVLKPFRVKIRDKAMLKYSLLYFVFIFVPYAILVIYGISFFGQFPFSTSTNWSFLGKGITGIILGLFNPFKLWLSILYDWELKRLWLLYTFGVLLFIPILAKREFLISLAPIFMFLVSTYRPYYQYGFQYGLIYVPLLIYAYIKGISRLPRDFKVTKIKVIGVSRFLSRARFKRKWFASISILLVIFLYPINIAYFGRDSPVNYFGGRSFIEPLPIPSSHTKVIYKAISLIPKDASVLAQMNIFPHLSHRAEAYVWLPEPDLYKVEYAIADKKSYYFNETPPGVNESYSVTFNKLLESGFYKVVFNEDGVVVLKKYVNARNYLKLEGFENQSSIFLKTEPFLTKSILLKPTSPIVSVRNSSLAAINSPSFWR